MRDFMFIWIRGTDRFPVERIILKAVPTCQGLLSEAHSEFILLILDPLSIQFPELSSLDCSWSGPLHLFPSRPPAFCIERAELPIILFPPSSSRAGLSDSDSAMIDPLAISSQSWRIGFDFSQVHRLFFSLRACRKCGSAFSLRSNHASACHGTLFNC